VLSDDEERLLLPLPESKLGRLKLAFSNRFKRREAKVAAYRS
jgi:hypothetical protein